MQVIIPPRRGARAFAVDPQTTKTMRTVAFVSLLVCLLHFVFVFAWFFHGYIKSDWTIFVNKSMQYLSKPDTAHGDLYHFVYLYIPAFFALGGFYEFWPLMKFCFNWKSYKGAKISVNKSNFFTIKVALPLNALLCAGVWYLIFSNPDHFLVQIAILFTWALYLKIAWVAGRSLYD